MTNVLTRRFIGIGYDDLKVRPNVAAVAFGPDKVSATGTVPRGGFVHGLITKPETAGDSSVLKRGEALLP